MTAVLSATPQAKNRTDARIYLDNQATTPCDPRVVEAMLPFFTEKFGNPHSVDHSYGWDAQEAVEQARQQIARLIGAQARVFARSSAPTSSPWPASTNASWSRSTRWPAKAWR